MLAVAHRVLVRVEALLERRSGEASVVLLSVLRTYNGPVNNRLDQTFTVHWAVCFHSTVAVRRAVRVVQRGGLAVNYSAVVLTIYIANHQAKNNASSDLVGVSLQCLEY